MISFQSYSLVCCVKKTGSNSILLPCVFFAVQDDDAEAAADSGSLGGRCTFPAWATDIGILHSFALTSQYTFSEDRMTMTMANYSHTSGEAFTKSISVCQKIVEELFTVDYVRLILKVTAKW